MHRRLAFLIGALALAVRVMPAGAALLFREDFRHGDATTGLPSGWFRQPDVHAPYFSTNRDADTFGVATPALRVDTPRLTLNYYVASPLIPVARLDGDYTLQVALRIDQPDSPFAVEVILHDAQGAFAGTARLLDLPGERMDSLRVYRVSFRPSALSGAGRLTLAFGLPYSRALHGGSFWIDDVELREGRETGALELYARPGTIAAGESVEVCVSAAKESATLIIYREGEASLPVYGPIALTDLREEPVPGEVWRRGCGWPAAAVIPTTEDWRSGLYRVKVDDGDRSRSAFFIVRGRGGEGPLLVILPTHTEAAYNKWGGRSFYTGGYAPEVSLDRPVDNSLIGAYGVPIHMLRWLSREGIGFGVAGDDDVNDHGKMLFRYPAIAITGHSEYWTRAMREAVEEYTAAGGSVLCLSGNTCWWQTRLESRPALGGDTGRVLVGYKYDMRNDPYWSIDSTLVTTRWDEPPLSEPPTRFLGLSWRYGGHVNWANSCPYDWVNGHGGYAAYRTDHWVFAGTGLADGDTFGQTLAIVGYEVDGAPIQWTDGHPETLPEGGTPPGFQVLGCAPCWNYLTVEDGVGVALMGILERGRAFVFNGGTTGWCWGLAGDPQVQQVTRNLIERVAQNSLPRTRPAALRIWPNPAWNGATLESPIAGRGSRVEVLDVLGRRVVVCPLTRMAPGRWRVRWDLCDARGAPLPAGAYWARLSGGSVRSTKLIVLDRP
jgi:hypothetical protein